MGSCKYCGRVINNAGSLKAHEMSCKENPSRIKHKTGIGGGWPKGKSSWNKGLTKENDPRMKKIGEKVSKAHTGKPWRPNSEESERIRREKISKSMKANPNAGGRRQGSGRGKQGWYKGYWCDSSWELAFVIYNLEYNIPFRRNLEKFFYEFEGKTHYWLPDFIMEDGTYYEIKGYENDKAKAKHSSFPLKLEVLKLSRMKKYLEYAENKYGKAYTKLYETGKTSR